MDFEIVQNGAVWLFTPISDKAKQFTDESIYTERWQWIGNAFAVDHRFAEILASELPELGFTIEEV